MYIQMYLWYQVKYGVTEESRGPQSNHESVEILVHVVELVVLVEQRYEEDTEKRHGTDNNHHQETITIG